MSETKEVLVQVAKEQEFIALAITFRVSGPIDREWKELRAVLSECWQDSTSLANWAVTEMGKADTVRTPDMEKLPPSPANKKGSPFYLYPFARKVCPKMDPHSVVALLNTVQSTYRRRRRDVIWKGEASLPRYRYPYPYSVPAAVWKPEYLSETEKVPVVAVTLRGVKFRLKLRTGPGFRRQMAQFAQIMAGTALKGQLDIFRERSNHADNRIGLQSHTQPGGGEAVHHNVVVKLVAKFPKRPVVNENVLFVNTASNSFVVLTQNDRELWRENADHVRGWISSHAATVHRLSEDLKFETRQGRRYQMILDKLERLTLNYKHRLHSFVHETTAHIVGKAQRGKCGKVVYDDADRSYFPSFQWADFKLTLKNKLVATGIEFCEREDAEKIADAARKL